MDRKKILEVMSNSNGIISTKEATNYGISRMALHRLKEQGAIRSVSRGVYCLNDEMPDTMLIIQIRCKRGTFSHETALYFHDLTDRTPSQHVMTVPANYNTTSLKDLPVKFRYVKPTLIDIGRKKMKTTQGNELYVYDIERTICDIIRNKASMDVNIVNSALRQYANSKKSKFSLLMIYAKKLQMEKKVHATMEVLF
ncbi:MAG: type IV toxin-antitoxin system AbiEi family antitoxin domain-containing protein [Peptostreptococcaceae bacterium]|nr:type IV toxin-antitoxin system AbiEi family antitoxin domain-containing protein [Peptostreptococcaceae bacterium]